MTYLISQTGALSHWLAPYSLDYNPVEAFSKAKSVMKAMEFEMTILGIDTIVYAVFSMITPLDCQGWITNSNIYLFSMCNY